MDPSAIYGVGLGVVVGVSDPREPTLENDGAFISFSHCLPSSPSAFFVFIVLLGALGPWSALSRVGQTKHHALIEPGACVHSTSDLTSHPDWPRWEEVLKGEAAMRRAARRARSDMMEKQLDEMIMADGDGGHGDGGADSDRMPPQELASKMLNDAAKAAEEVPEAHAAPMDLDVFAGYEAETDAAVQGG